jgi:hypothetical protein
MRQSGQTSYHRESLPPSGSEGSGAGVQRSLIYSKFRLVTPDGDALNAASLLEFPFVSS